MGFLAIALLLSKKTSVLSVELLRPINWSAKEKRDNNNVNTFKSLKLINYLFGQLHFTIFFNLGIYKESSAYPKLLR